MRFETAAIHAGEEPRFGPNCSGDVVVPIHLSSTFARCEVDTPTGGYEYSRTGNPTRGALEERLAALEGAGWALAFSSGMAAEAAIGYTLLRPGDHIVAFDDLYGGTWRLFEKVFRTGLEVDISYVDARDAANVAEAMTDRTKLVWMETPTNPLMKLCDIEAVCAAAAERGALVAVDNTFATPYFQKPLELGADVVVHSTSKYLNGHSDSVGGAVMLSNEDLYERLKFNQNAVGAVLAPFDSYLVLRGIKTLPVRMREHERNALLVAQHLESHPNVTRVLYPGLPSHPQHDLAARQMSGFGGMLSFEIAGGLPEARAFLQNLAVFSLAESLGGVESLIEHPALMTHASIPREEREKVGVTDSLVRISVGIENVEDLTEDLDRGLAAAA